MKKITFKNKEIFYGDELIGTYEQHFADRFIPKFKKKWHFIYYQFDFYEGKNGDEDFFKNKVTKIVEKTASLFIKNSEFENVVKVLDGLVTDVGSLLSDVADLDFEWQQAGYYEDAKVLLKDFVVK
jgi:hypothetical protein